MEKFTIYIVDDDRDDLELLSESFQQSNCAGALHLLTSAEELFDKLNSSEPVIPDLIVLDHQAPGTNGSQALEILREDNRYNGAAIVVYSTHLTPAKQKELRDKGADACLAKGLTVNEIAAHVQQFCAVTATKKGEPGTEPLQVY